MKRIFFFTLMTLPSLGTIPRAFADMYRITTPFPGLTSSTPDLGTYIGAILQFSFAVIGVVAIGAIVYWSITWILSRGNPGAINNAKNGIMQAIYGVVLLFASYVILNTINPALVKIGNTQQELTGMFPPITDTSAFTGGASGSW